jgi:sporulation protein YhbH
MALKIEQDRARFRQIIRGKVRANLRKYIAKGELMGRQGKDVISIPLPEIHLPRFRFDPQQEKGVGSGQGEPGDPMDGEEGEEGSGKAGDQEGEHALEEELTIAELAEILGEELALPRIEPRGRHEIKTSKFKLTSVRRTGPESLRHFKRTYKEALKRQIASGTYNPERPIIVPVRQDRRYRSWKNQTQPFSAAVILYMMDVSGSMGDEQKEIVRIESFWIDTWLRSQYDGFETRYIIHDATAQEVDRETFFRTKESGGTIISSAYKKALEILEADYPTNEWNVYCFHFSDGDNWSNQDNKDCVELLREYIFPRCNLFGYGQVESPYGSGQFIRELEKELPDEETLITSRIPDREHIVDSIRDFLGKGR